MRETISVENTQPFTDVLQAVSKIPEIQTDACEKLFRSQSGWMELCMEYGARQMQAFDGNRDLPESLATQSELLTEYSTKLFDCAVDVFDIVSKANAEMMSCLGMGVAGEAPAAAPGKRAKAGTASSKSRRTVEVSAA